MLKQQKYTGHFKMITGKPKTKLNKNERLIGIALHKIYDLQDMLELVPWASYGDEFYTYFYNRLMHVKDMAADPGNHGKVLNVLLTNKTHYVESGRQYGALLQTVPRMIRRAALHGHWNHDFENCHWVILRTLANQHGMTLPAIDNYIQHKRAIRERLARETGITVDAAKKCLLILMYGGGNNAGTYKKNGKKKETSLKEAAGDNAKLVLKHPVYAALRKEVTSAGKVVVDNCGTNRQSVINSRGGKISKKASDAKKLAHVLQGYESQMLDMAIEMYGEPVLPLHDGFIHETRKDVAPLIKRIHDEMGFNMEMEVSQVIAPTQDELNKVMGKEYYVTPFDHENLTMCVYYKPSNKGNK